MSWLTDTFIATAALIAAVLVLRRPVARWFGPGMAYALWALPLLRLVLPPLLMPTDAPASADTVIYQLVAASDASAVAPSPAAAWSDLAPILQAAWLAGALAFAFWRAWSYRAMRRTLLADARAVGQAGTVRLVEAPHASAPVAFGLFDKVVALPPGFMAQPDRTARDLAIAHELEHHAGRDLAVNIAMQPLLALHWFNPLAWAGWRALRRDQEAACDARVLAGRCNAERAAYGRLIASFSQGPHLALAAPMACPVLGEKSIVHRLRSLTMSQPSPRRTRLGRMLIGAAVLALPLTATVSRAEPDAAAVPESPAAPDTAAAPDAPALHSEHRVVIIEKGSKGGSHDKQLKTRVVERDGRTVVFKTDKDLTDAEIEARIEQAFSDLPAITDPLAPPSPPSVANGPRPPAPPAPPGEHRTRMVLVTADGHSETIKLEGEPNCTGEWSQTRAEGKQDGHRKVMIVNICAATKDAHAKAADGLRKARERIAADHSLSDEIRKSILDQLDAEIARLSSEG